MYPNTPDPQQPEQPSPQPNPGWGQPQQSQNQYQQQYQPQQPPQPQQPIQPMPYGQGSMQYPGYQPPVQQPQPPIQPVPPLGATNLPPLQTKKPKTIRGPFALLFNDWMRRHWKAVVFSVLGLIVLGNVIFQIVYPSGRMLPGANVDGVNVSGMRKADAAKKLDDLYGDVKLNIFFGKNDAAFLNPMIKDVGISVQNEDRLAVMQYPFYLRIIPTSIFWANSTMKPGAYAYNYDKQKIQDYTQGKVGDSCTIPAQDATLKLIDSQLQVVSSVPGGTCDIAQFQSILAQVAPTATSDNNVRIDSTETPAKVDDDKARALADKLNNRLKADMPIALDSSTDNVPGRIVLSWLDFKSDVPEASIDDANQTAKLVYSVNRDRAQSYLNSGIAAKIIKKPGVSKVSTLDFTETSRVNGAGGRALNLDKTIGSVTDYIESKNNQAVAVPQDVGPTVIYTRTYTATQNGLNALFAQFAQDNPGTYGLAMNEISGVKVLRNASFNADTRFKTAGIDSLYIGYGINVANLNGSLLPGTIIAGNRNVGKCFSDMFVKSDDDCRIGFYNYLGYDTMKARGAEIGLKNTVYSNKDGQTSANDLQQFMLGLAKNTVARAQNGQQLLASGRGITANEGIPTGTGSKDVAHFVGESDTIHNDTAFVNSNRGSYVLTILSDGSSWDKVADLAKKITDFKLMKPPGGDF